LLAQEGSAKFYYGLEDLRDPARDFFPLRDERLTVTRIKFSSPGLTDVAGIGSIVGHVKDFVIHIIDRNDAKQRRQLENEALALDNNRKRLEIAREYISLADELGLGEAERRMLLTKVFESDSVIEKLVRDGNIRALSQPDN
jgi:hypothetical protein